MDIPTVVQCETCCVVVGKSSVGKFVSLADKAAHVGIDHSLANHPNLRQSSDTDLFIPKLILTIETATSTQLDIENGEIPLTKLPKCSTNIFTSYIAKIQTRRKKARVVIVLCLLVDAPIR